MSSEQAIVTSGSPTGLPASPTVPDSDNSNTSSARPAVEETVDPPTYLTAVSSSGPNFGFPPGYFIIRSVATGRLLDVAHNELSDGAEVISWPEMESSLVEGFRKPEADNQVFFIDTTGALCSRQSGHAIDVEDGKLVLRHRRPISYPYPNGFSHPLPQFTYSTVSKQLSVRFSCDPSYPVQRAETSTTPRSPTSQAWHQKKYLVTSIPLRRPRSILDDASDVFSGVLAAPLSLFGSAKPQSTPEEVFASDIDLREDEVVDEDRLEGEEADNSPERLRIVRVIALTQEDERRLAAPGKLRRQWEVIPLRRSRALYNRNGF